LTQRCRGCNQFGDVLVDKNTWNKFPGSEYSIDNNEKMRNETGYPINKQTEN
jgi:nitrate reductase beta subunit